MILFDWFLLSPLKETNRTVSIFVDYKIQMYTVIYDRKAI